MASQYYYTRNGQRQGPVSSAHLRELAAAGQLAPTDLVWKEGAADWVPAAGIKGLFPAAPELTVAAGAVPPADAIQKTPAPPPQAIPLGGAAAPAPAVGAVVPLPQRVLAEVKETAGATINHVRGLVRRGTGVRQKQLLQQKAVEAQAALGRRLHEARLGDGGLRAQLDQLEERIRNLRAAKAATASQEAERKGLHVRLAEPFLSQAAPPGLEKEHADAVAAQAAVQAHQQNQKPVELLPSDKGVRLRVALGCGAAALVLGTVMLFCAGTASLVFWRVGGNPQGPGSRKLVGTWEAKFNVFGLETNVTVDFKSNGRFTAVDGLGDTYSGTWKVNLVEGKVYQLHIVYDYEPDRVKGWTVTFKDNDTITLDGFMGIPPTLKRKK